MACSLFLNIFWHLRNKDQTFVSSLKLLINVWTFPGCAINHITIHLHKEIFVRKLRGDGGISILLAMGTHF